MSVLVITASPRTDGHTAAAVDRLCLAMPGMTETINLAGRSIGAFDYAKTDDRDDFRAIVREMAAHPAIVLATPIYWHAMSGLMKTFFDRFTDLLLDPAARPIARALAGRGLWVLATGSDPAAPDGFDEPFRRTAAYFGMVWRGGTYVRFAGSDRAVSADFSVVEGLAEQLRRNQPGFA